MQHVCALCRLHSNLQLEVSTGIVLKHSVLYERVPLAVLLYESITSSSHVSCAFSLMSSSPIGTVVCLSAANKKEGVVWLL